MHSRVARARTEPYAAGRVATLLVVASLALVVLAIPTEADALTLRLSISERASLSADVFVGTVGGHTARLRGKNVSTSYTTLTKRTLKGRAPSAIELMGGTAGSRVEWVSDQPALLPGKTYLFFLDSTGRPVGGPQGAVAMEGDRLAGTRIRVSDVANAIVSTSLGPQQSRAFPEARTQAGRASAFAAIDAALTAADLSPAAPSGSSAAAPVIVAVSPEQVAAGTTTTVEIDGSGFGTTPGRIEMVYDPESGASYARQAVARTTWTDSRITFKVPVFTDRSGYPGAPGSGAVRITTATGQSVDSPPLQVTYAFDGDQWPSTPVSVYVNPSSAPDPPAALDMVSTATSTWAAGGFSLSFAGQIGTPVGPVDRDGINEVGWGTAAAGILAQSSWARDKSGNVLEEHIVFNTSYRWGDGSRDTSGYLTYDVESTALHELGHWVVLRDKYSPNDSYQVMYGYGQAGRQKRSLTQAEIDGVNYVYGSDRLAPVTSVVVSSTAGFVNGWTSGDVTVTVAPPQDANLRATHYRLDYGDAVEVSGPMDLTFSDEGRHDVMVWSSDDAGNNEIPAHKVVAIDRTPPASSSDATAAYGGRATVKFSGSDALSGLDRIEWRLVDSPSWTSGTSVTFSAAGQYSLEFRAVDRAGNAEEAHTIQFEVLPLQPTALQLGTPPRSVKYGTQVSIEGTLTTAGAELVGQPVTLQWSSTGSAWADSSTQPTVSGGRFAFSATVKANTYYRAVYRGGLVPGLAYAPAPMPAGVLMNSTAYMGTPNVSRVRTRTYDLWVMLLPRHAAGTYPARIYLERYAGGGRWVKYGYVGAKGSNSGTSSTKALRRYTFPATGTWRIRAYHRDASHIATWSAYRTFAVR